MKKYAVILSVLAVFVMGATVFAADAPKGCSGCHSGKYALGAEVKNVKGHPALPETATFDTCAKCHKDSGPLAFSPILHKVHYQKGADSYFVKEYGGQCQQCHIVDVTTGNFKSVQK